MLTALVCQNYFTWNKHFIALVIWAGNVLSSTSTSFEKRDRIRPMGVVSKKFNGERNTPVRMYLCRRTDAPRQPILGPNSLKIANRAEKIYLIFFFFNYHSQPVKIMGMSVDFCKQKYTQFMWSEHFSDQNRLFFFNVCIRTDCNSSKSSYKKAERHKSCK